VGQPLAVAITGGIGAGKSEALAAFRRHGAATVSSDEIVHHLLAENEEVGAAVTERFGSTDRARIAEVVFADPAELEWLEALLHPLVSHEYLTWRERLAELPDAPKVCVTEVPLLYEVGADERFDKVVVITAPETMRAERTRVPGDGRAERLLPEEEKVERADFSYVNDGSLDELDAFVAGVMEELA